MYIVVQEIELKKANKYGYSKRIEAYQMSFGISGEDSRVKNCHMYSSERFERPIKKAYKISVHHSYRENGKVKKKQSVISTINYYDLIDLSLYDHISDNKIELIANEFETTTNDIYNMIYDKTDPIMAKIKKEFEQTEEFKTHQEHEEITTIYVAKKIQFASDYGVDKDEYDYCYNVFGELTNEEYLNKIKEQRKQKSSYYEDFFNNYKKGNYSNYSNSNYDSSSYLNFNQSNYTEEEKKDLKSFFRVLAKNFHPDLNPGKDTTKEMQLLNKLSEQWGIN